MIGRLIERLFVQVRADMSDLGKDLQQGVSQTRNSTTQMATSWKVVAREVNRYTSELMKGKINQAQYTAGMNRLSSQMKNVAGSYRIAQKEVWGYAAAARAANQVRIDPRPMRAFTRSAGQARMQMMNLGYQINDVGMTLATGMNPLTVLIQQGSQILQIYAGQGGIRTALGDLGRMLSGLVRKAWPLAVIAGLFAELRSRINESSNITVGFGDTMLAVFQVISSKIRSTLGPSFSWLVEKLTPIWDWIVDSAVWAADKIINSIRVAVSFVPKILAQVPPFFQAAFSRATAEVAYAMADIMSFVSRMTGKVSGAMNEAFGTAFETDPMHEAVGYFNRMGNDLLVSSEAIMDGVVSEMAAAREEAGQIWASSPMSDFFGEVQNQAVVNAMNGAAEAAEEMGGRASDAINQAEDATNTWLETLQSVADNMQQALSSGLMAMAEGTKTAKEAFRSMARDIIKQLYDILVVQQIVGNFNAQTGKGSGIMGAVMGAFTGGFGARARGGVEMPWRGFVAGEEGPEIVSQDGPAGARRVMTAGRTRSMISGSPQDRSSSKSSGGTTVIVNQTLNISAGVGPTVRSEVLQLMPRIVEATKSGVLDARRRGGTYAEAF